MYPSILLKKLYIISRRETSVYTSLRFNQVYEYLRGYQCLRTTIFLIVLIAICTPMSTLHAQKLSQSQLNEEVKRLRIQVEEQPNNTQVQSKLAIRLVKLRRYRESIPLLQTLAIKTNGKTKYKAIYLLGFAQRQLKRYPAALSAYQSYIKELESKGKDATKGYLGLAKTLELQGDPQGAIEAYQIFIDKGKDTQKTALLKAARVAIQRLNTSQVTQIKTTKTEESTELMNTDQGDARKSQIKEQTRIATASNTSSPTHMIKQGEDQLRKDLVVRQPPISVKHQDGSPVKSHENTQSVLLSGQPSWEGLGDRSRSVGDERFASGDYRGAWVAYYEAWGRSPESFDLLYQSAVCAYLSNQYVQSLQLAEEGVLRENSEYSRFFEGLAILSVLRIPKNQPHMSRLELALREGRFNDVIDSIRHLKEFKLTAQDKLRLMVAEGQALIALGRFTEGLKMLNQAEKRQPTPLLSIQVAQAAIASRKPNVAKAAYQRARKILLSEDFGERSPLISLIDHSLSTLK